MKGEEEIQVITKEEDLRNKKKELKDMDKIREEQLQSKKSVEEQMDLDEKIFEIAKKDFKLLKPVWSYETNEDYLKYLLRMKEIGFEQNQMNRKSQLKQIDKNLAALDEQTESLLGSIEKIEKELKEDE